MNDDQILLANAYFDDDLDVDARARAEGDPEVMAEVERLRHLRHELRDTAAPSPAARDAAIAAAMTHFAPAGRQTSAPPPTPVPASARRRFDYARPLGFAAALVAIGVLGAVVVNSTGGDDADDAGGEASREPATSQFATADAAGDDAADMEDAANDDDIATEDSATAEVSAADGDAAVSSPAMAESTASDDVAELDAAGGAAADVEASADMNGDTAESDETAVMVLRPSPDGAQVMIGGGQLLPTLERVIEVATELTDLRASNALPPTPNTRCAPPDPDQTSEILAEPEFETESGARRLLVAVDRVDGFVFGVDPDTCAVVVAGPLP